MGSITVTSLLLLIVLQLFITSVNCQVEPNYDLTDLTLQIWEQFQVNNLVDMSPGVIDVISELRPENILKAGMERSLQGINDRESGSETKCNRQFGIFQSGVENLEEWALKMIDSSSKIPAGILEGNLKDLGVYDECVASNVQKKDEFIRGRHCMYSFLVKEPRTNMKIMPTFSICVPDGCNADDVTEIIQKGIDLISNNRSLDPAVKSVTCSALEPEPWDAGGIMTLILLCFYLFVLTCCTICELFFPRSSNTSVEKISQILSKFSLYANGKRILSMKIPRENLPVLQGIRFFSMSWVVLGHVFYNHLVFGVLSNHLVAVKWLKSWSSLYIVIAPFTVDSFFAISGFLIGYLFMKEMAKGHKFNVVMYYVHRYIRLTPAFAVLLLLAIHVFPRIGSGAVWETNMLQQRDSCLKNWWANLLYVQNYVNTQYLMCLGQTWYLAADMQFFWLSPLIVYPLARKPKVGLAIWSVFMIASVLSPAISSAANEYSGGLFQTTNATHMSNMMRYHYVASHTRAGPWLMGIFMGYKLAVMKDRILNPKFVMLGWISAVLAFAFGFFSYRVFQADGYEYELGWEIFYAGFARHIWAYGVCWLIFASVLGYGGFIGKFLALPVFMPLGRIAYCIYLVHFIIQFMRLSAARVPVYFSNSTMLYVFCSDFILCILYGFLFSLFFESPFMVLEKIILGRMKGDKESNRTRNFPKNIVTAIVNENYQYDNEHVECEKK